MRVLAMGIADLVLPLGMLEPRCWQDHRPRSLLQLQHLPRTHKLFGCLLEQQLHAQLAPWLGL